jgi:guanylate kinase
MKTPLIIVSAPSGGGKSSLCNRALEEFSQLMDSVSYTTRAPRPGEVEGNPYHFVTKEKFEELRDHGFFIETAVVHNHLYGTPKDQVEKAKALGKVLIMDIDVQGAASFRKIYPDAVYIFILPPSIDELRRRLVKRDSGKTSNLEVRLEAAKKELAMAPLFQYQIVNDDFEHSYAQFKKIIDDYLKPC